MDKELVYTYNSKRDAIMANTAAVVHGIEEQLEKVAGKKVTPEGIRNYFAELRTRELPYLLSEVKAYDDMIGSYLERSAEWIDAVRSKTSTYNAAGRQTLSEILGTVQELAPIAREVSGSVSGLYTAIGEKMGGFESLAMSGPTNVAAMKNKIMFVSEKGELTKALVEVDRAARDVRLKSNALQGRMQDLERAMQNRQRYSPNDTQPVKPLTEADIERIRKEMDRSVEPYDHDLV